MTKTTLLFAFSVLFSFSLFSQNIGINLTGNAGNSRSLLDLDANGLGLLIPRMTTTIRDTIGTAGPAIPEGLFIFNTTTKCFEAYVNSSWNKVSCPAACTPPVAPTTGTHAPWQTQIVWNWNTVSGAAGYQWNTTSTYPGSGVNVVTTPTYTQTGLTCNTAYTLYVWAYNSCGNSSSTTLTQTSATCCSGGIITTVAGSGTAGYSGDTGPATSANLNNPHSMAVDAAGNMYIADMTNNRVRKVSIAGGQITTIAGTGTAGSSGDGGAATSALLSSPSGVAVDGSGNVYICESSKIRKVTASTGIITTVAGTGTAGYNSDGIAATSAQLNQPWSVAVDASGNLYISDYSNHRIRKVTASTGIISTIAGDGTGAYSGDGGAATSAQIYYPWQVALDGSGNVYIADYSNQVIRKVTISTGNISTIAGNNALGMGYTGDGGAATSARLGLPRGVAVDASGNVYIGDYNNSVIRKVTVATGIITTFAGTTNGFSGDGGAATSAQIKWPSGVSVDSSGNVYIPDQSNNRIRKVCP